MEAKKGRRWTVGRGRGGGKVGVGRDMKICNSGGRVAEGDGGFPLCGSYVTTKVMVLDGWFERCDEATL